MLGGYEPRHRNGYLYCGGGHSLGRGGVPNLANLAMLLVGGLRVPVRERVRGQRAQRKDERECQHPSNYSLRHAQNQTK
jgi:hypothetical protein